MVDCIKQRPLNIVVAHNRYRQTGGEDFVASAEAALLKRKGHHVVTYERHNDEIHASSVAGVSIETFWSKRTVRDITRLLSETQADVLHVHNTFPLLSPSIYWAANLAGVPVVQTLHNYRLLCPQAMFLRDGKVCEECLGRLPWRGAVRGCYGGSRSRSAVLASMLALHRGIGTWRSKVTRYIALTEFGRSKFIEGGLPAERIEVKPNFVEVDVPQRRDRDGFLFVGRLSPEKGVATLVQAGNRLPTTRVRIAGAGPEAARMQQQAGPSLVFLGTLSPEEVWDEMASALALVMPSICYEGFPLVILEAFACGLPVIASRIGVLPSMIESGVSGLLFEPGDAMALEEKMRWALEHREDLARMGGDARARYDADYAPEGNYPRLLKVYRNAINALDPASCAQHAP